ncbi:hypothetical protein Plhal703r1_c60g0165281 [Plasmopara halstedii]
MLCKVILAGRLTLNFPSWADPVIRLFDQAISPWGEDFDILYAPVTTSPDYAISRRSKRWAGLCLSFGTPTLGKKTHPATS